MAGSFSEHADQMDVGYVADLARIQSEVAEIEDDELRAEILEARRKLNV